MRHWAAGRDDPPAKKAPEPTDAPDDAPNDDAAPEVDPDEPWGGAEFVLPEWLATKHAAASSVPEGSFFFGEGDHWPAHHGDFPLWPENAEAFFHFEACRTQWHHTEGVRTGLMYDSAWTWVARAQRYRFTPERHALLQLMEGAALKLWNDELRERAKRIKDAG